MNPTTNVIAITSPGSTDWLELILSSATATLPYRNGTEPINQILLIL